MNEKQFEKWMKDIERRLESLEHNTHPPREFIRCDACMAKIKEKE